jgi:hypothetical protein
MPPKPREHGPRDADPLTLCYGARMKNQLLPDPQGLGEQDLHLFREGAKAGQAYKFMNCTHEVEWLQKADPFARHAEFPPGHRLAAVASSTRMKRENDFDHFL